MGSGPATPGARASGEPACGPGVACRVSSSGSGLWPAVARSPPDPRSPGSRTSCKTFADDVCQPPGQPQLLVSKVQLGAPRSAVGLGGSQRLPLARAGRAVPPSVALPVPTAATSVAAPAPAAVGSYAAALAGSLAGHLPPLPSSGQDTSGTTARSDLGSPLPPSLPSTASMPPGQEVYGRYRLLGAAPLSASLPSPSAAVPAVDSALLSHSKKPERAAQPSAALPPLVPPPSPSAAVPAVDSALLSHSKKTERAPDEPMPAAQPSAALPPLAPPPSPSAAVPAVDSALLSHSKNPERAPDEPMPAAQPSAALPPLAPPPSPPATSLAHGLSGAGS